MEDEQVGLDPASSTTAPGGYHGNYLRVDLRPHDRTPVTAQRVSLDPWTRGHEAPASPSALGP